MIRQPGTASTRRPAALRIPHPPCIPPKTAPQLRAAWEEHKDRYPERTRATSRTEADGTWVCGEYRGLDPEQNTEAGKAHADLADEADRHILPALRRIEAADPERRRPESGCRFEMQFHTPESLEAKELTHESSSASLT
jgi:hypothetical protein